MSRRRWAARATGSTPSGWRSRPISRFVVGHKEVYRIIDEAEFVDPAGFRTHYETTAARIAGRLAGGGRAGRDRKAAMRFATEVRAWAIMGMNVFLGLRFGVWGKEPPAEVAAEVNRLLRKGLEG